MGESVKSPVMKIIKIFLASSSELKNGPQSGSLHDLAIFIFGQREMVVLVAIANAESPILSLVVTEFCQVV